MLQLMLLPMTKSVMPVALQLQRKFTPAFTLAYLSMYIAAGELYPTEVRTTAHGISAGVAKLGAVWASIWFNYNPMVVNRYVPLELVFSVQHEAAQVCDVDHLCGQLVTSVLFVKS